MADPRSMRPPRQIVLAAQSLSLLSVALPFVGPLLLVSVIVSTFAAIVVAATVATRPVADRVVRWLTGLGAVGIAGALFSLWLIRDEEAAIPIGQFGGLLLSLAVTIAMMFVLVGELRRSSVSTT